MEGVMKEKKLSEKPVVGVLRAVYMPWVCIKATVPPEHCTIYGFSLFLQGPVWRFSLFLQFVDVFCSTGL